MIIRHFMLEIRQRLRTGHTHLAPPVYGEQFTLIAPDENILYGFDPLIPVRGPLVHWYTGHFADSVISQIRDHRMDFDRAAIRDGADHFPDKPPQLQAAVRSVVDHRNIPHVRVRGKARAQPIGIDDMQRELHALFYREPKDPAVALVGDPPFQKIERILRRDDRDILSRNARTEPFDHRLYRALELVEPDICYRIDKRAGQPTQVSLGMRGHPGRRLVAVDRGVDQRARNLTPAVSKDAIAPTAARPD